MRKPVKGEEKEEEDLFDFTPEGYQRCPPISIFIRKVLMKVKTVFTRLIGLPL